MWFNWNQGINFLEDFISDLPTIINPFLSIYNSLYDWVSVFLDILPLPSLHIYNIQNDVMCKIHTFGHQRHNSYRPFSRLSLFQHSPKYLVSYLIAKIYYCNTDSGLFTRTSSSTLLGFWGPYVSIDIVNRCNGQINCHYFAANSDLERPPIYGRFFNR